MLTVKLPWKYHFLAHYYRALEYSSHEDLYLRTKNARACRYVYDSFRVDDFDRSKLDEVFTKELYDVKTMSLRHSKKTKGIIGEASRKAWDDYTYEERKERVARRAATKCGISLEETKERYDLKQADPKNYRSILALSKRKHLKLEEAIEAFETYDYREAISERSKRLWEENYEKMSRINLGRKHVEENEPRNGNEKVAVEKKPHYSWSDYARQKAKEARRRPESREKLRAANRRTNEKRKIDVLCVETGVVYRGLNETQRQTGVGNVGRAIRKGTTAGGFHWKKIETKSS